MRRHQARRAAIGGAVSVAVLLTAAVALGSATVGTSMVSASAATKPVSLSGATLNFADQFKEYQTIFDATGALQGAPYTVNWSEFVGGPPIIAAETGGSVDLGDMAETPTIFAQAAGDPVKVVAATKSADARSHRSPFWCRSTHPSRRCPSSAARPSPSRRARSSSTFLSRSSRRPGSRPAR